MWIVPPLIVALSCELCCLFGVHLDSILTSNRHQFHQYENDPKFTSRRSRYVPSSYRYRHSSGLYQSRDGNMVLLIIFHVSKSPRWKRYNHQNITMVHIEHARKEILVKDHIETFHSQSLSIFLRNLSFPRVMISPSPKIPAMLTMTSPQLRLVQIVFAWSLRSNCWTVKLKPISCRHLIHYYAEGNLSVSKR